MILEKYRDTSFHSASATHSNIDWKKKSLFGSRSVMARILEYGSNSSSLSGETILARTAHLGSERYYCPSFCEMASPVEVGPF